MEIQHLITDLQQIMQTSGPRARVNVSCTGERNGHYQTIAAPVIQVRQAGEKVTIEAD